MPTNLPGTFLGSNGEPPSISVDVERPLFNSVIDWLGSSPAGQNSEKASIQCPSLPDSGRQDRRILPLELVTLTYALFRLFWGSLRHPLFPREYARASASAGAVSHELGVIGTASGFPVTHCIERSSNPAIQP